MKLICWYFRIRSIRKKQREERIRLPIWIESWRTGLETVKKREKEQVPWIFLVMSCRLNCRDKELKWWDWMGLLFNLRRLTIKCTFNCRKKIKRLMSWHGMLKFVIKKKNNTCIKSIVYKDNFKIYLRTSNQSKTMH